MRNKWIVSIVSGLTATVIMTIVGLMAPAMGLPKMNPAEILSMMMGFPLLLGWIMHFMIGVVFSFGYTILRNKCCDRISNFLLRGVLFGFAVFVFAQIMMTLSSIMIAPPPMEGTMIANLTGSFIGHIIYGITIAGIGRIFNS